VLARYPHPGRGFTQGLLAGTGSARSAAGSPPGQLAVWESTGLYGESALIRYRLGHLQPQRRAALEPDLFGEGICRIGAHIWQLTWQERVALRWDARTLEPLGRVAYNREGWGICAAFGYAFTSDGSSELVRRDPGTLAPFDVLKVRCDGARVPGLNDLAWSGGRIWANVIGTDVLAGIDPDDGEVTDVVDAGSARERQLADPQAVMNGVAALPAAGEFLLTGKTYRQVYHVRLVPARDRPGRRAVRRLTAGLGGFAE
jgi:glutaminyl-peptide cyclotransferase